MTLNGNEYRSEYDYDINYHRYFINDKEVDEEEFSDRLLEDEKIDDEIE